MSGESINIPDPEWDQKINKLRALESVEGRQRQVEFICIAPVYTVAKGGDLDKFIEALENYSVKEMASLYDIICTRGLWENSLFHVAAGIENANILRALLEVIDDEQLIAQPNQSGDTALHVAARARRRHTAECLLKFDRIVDQSNWEGNTALHEAVKNGDYELTDLLLRQGSLSVNKMNKEEKCPLYLAVETGNLEILSRLLEAVDENEDLSSQIEGISPAHGAVVHRRIDMLIEMSERRKGLFNLRLFGAPLHLAASENYVDGVELLVDKFNMSSFEPNEQGYLPIHVACKMGHLETIKVLRQHWQDWLEPNELLTYDEEQNILHVAAKYGRASVVKYILGDPKLEKLINAKDKYGNTPLHVATEQWQPNVMLSLTRDNRVNLGLVNHNNSTALDIVDKQLQQIEGPFHQTLTRTILVSAGAPRSKVQAILQRRSDSWMEPPDIHKLNRHAEVRMVVATLIAGVTFAAGFSVPGGYNSSGPEAGIATLLNKPVYDVFMICNSIAMYNSIITVVFLLWTQINDSHAVFRALGMTRLPLLIALATMSMAFLAGIYVTTSKHTWVVIVTLVVGITALFVILILYIALYVPLGYNYRLVQFFADYIIRAAILISRRVSVIEEASEGCSCGPAVAYGRPPSWRGSVTIGTSWCPPGPNAIMLPPPLDPTAPTPTSPTPSPSPDPAPSPPCARSTQITP